MYLITITWLDTFHFWQISDNFHGTEGVVKMRILRFKEISWMPTYFAKFDDASFYLCNATSSSRCTNTTINELLEELLAEILVRISPYPSCVLTISAAHKVWRQLMGSNGFRNLTLSRNRGMPLLGFFTNSSEDRRFITARNLDWAILHKLAIRPGLSTSVKIYVLACLHGWVLLHYPRYQQELYV